MAAPKFPRQYGSGIYTRTLFLQECTLIIPFYNPVIRTLLYLHDRDICDFDQDDAESMRSQLRKELIHQQCTKIATSWWRLALDKQMTEEQLDQLLGKILPETGSGDKEFIRSQTSRCSNCC